MMAAFNMLVYLLMVMAVLETGSQVVELAASSGAPTAPFRTMPALNAALTEDLYPNPPFHASLRMLCTEVAVSSGGRSPAASGTPAAARWPAP